MSNSRAICMDSFRVIIMKIRTLYAEGKFLRLDNEHSNRIRRSRCPSSVEKLHLKGTLIYLSDTDYNTITLSVARIFQCTIITPMGYIYHVKQNKPFAFSY